LILNSKKNGLHDIPKGISTLTVITRKKLSDYMEDDVTSVWSSLGSSMGVSSVVREELEKLRVELRDTKLEVARDISELREVIHNIGIEMEQVVQRSLSLMTRLEGLESRAQSLSGGLTSEFNAFAYATLDELEPEYSEVEENESNSPLVEVDVEELRSDPPEEKLAVKDISPTQENSEITEWGTEDIVAYVLEQVNSDIDSIGGVLNNQLYLRYPEGIKGTPETKRMLKELLADDESVEVHKLDKFRSLYYRTGDDPDAIYKRIFG
jgi:hypothetical protein